MKWKGRRQSINVKDIRNVSSITINWSEEGYTDEDNLEVLDTGMYNIYINSDGVATGEIADASSISIILGISNKTTSRRSITPGQKSTLRNLLKSIAQIKRDLRFSSNTGELEEVTQAIYRNILG